MKIYEFEGFPNPARIRIALAEKGLMDQVTFVSVDVPGGEHKQPAYLAKNPSGAVPALELDCGTVIAECTAITEYLDHISGEPVLTGRTPKDRAIIHMMQRRAEARLLDAVGAYFHHATPGLGAEIEGYQCAEWGEHQKEEALTGMGYFDGVLAVQPFISGDTFSMADITAFAGLGFADFAGIAIPDTYKNLQDWRERVATRPSIGG